jgi:uncharacterized protein YtpQ (UPF0354 family)
VKLIKRLLGRPDQDDFARMVTDALRRAGNTDPVDYDPQGFKLVMAGGTQFYLANAYGDYLKAPRQQRADVLARYAASWTTATDGQVPLEEALPNLVPIVRARNFYDITKLRSRVEGHKEPDVPLLPLADHLAVSLAVDSPANIRYVGQDDLSAWGISFEDALESARDNLWNASGGKFANPAAGVYLASWNDSYDSSRLFLYDLLWHLDVDGDHVAAVPNRETLIVTGSEDYGGLAMMAKLCAKAQDEPRPTSCIPVILKDKEWVTYQPEPGHPEYESFKKLRIIEDARDYAEQGELLERWHNATGEEVFVASYGTAKREDADAYTSYSVWTEGVTTLLPKTDEVAFVQGKRVLGRAPWNEVRQIAGDLMQQLDMYPRRFKVEKFPSAEQLARLLR